MELKTCNILGLDILVTDMEKTVRSAVSHGTGRCRVCSAGWRAAFRLQQKTRIPGGGACDGTGSDACIICTR